MRIVTVLASRSLPPITSPLNVSACILWLDGNDLTTLFQDSAGTTPVTTTAQPVGRWADKSGAGNHVTQSTAGARPTYTTNVLNSKPALSFDGGDYLDTAGAIVKPANASLFVVCRTNLVNGTAFGLVSARHSTNGGVYLAQHTIDTFRVTRTPTAITATTPTITATTPYILTGVTDTLSAQAYLNGGSPSTVSASYSGTTPQMVRLAAISNNSTSTLWAGHIMEIIIYDRTLAEGEVTQVRNWLNAKWGVY